MAKLAVTKGSNAGDEFELGDLAVIGRSFDADVRIDDLTVSRKHAQITLSGDDYLIEDLGSGNGTRVNGEMVVGQRPLAPDDQIEISQNILTFMIDLPELEDVDIPQPDEATTTTVKVVEKEGGEGDAAILEVVDVGEDAISPAPDENETYENLTKMHQRLRTLCQISNDIGSTLKETELLDQIMDRLLSVFDQADRGFIVIRDPVTRRLVPKVSRRRDGGNPEELTISRTIVQTVMDNKQGVLSSDAMGDSRFAGGQSIVNFQIRSMMCVPLMTRDEIMGIIHLDTVSQGKHFEADDLTLLAGIASQAAVAISNARMHGQMVKQEKMQRDLDLAQHIQESFLPQSVPEIESYDFRHWYRAALEVGGDFYDFIVLDEDRVGIVVGDVSGKGIPAALLMAKMMSDVRFAALQETEPKNIVRRLNDIMAEGATEDMFVTFLFATLYVKERRLVMANAGHLPPVVRRGASNEVCQVGELVNYPLGVMPDVEFDQEEFVIEPGDTVAIFTDGVIEAMDGEKNQYGFERLEATMAEDTSDPSVLLHNILSDVKRFAGDTPQSDDLTLVCVGHKQDVALPP